MTVEQIKTAIRRLSLEERAEVAACLHSWTEDTWDAELRRDSAAGELDAKKFESAPLGAKPPKIQ